MRTIETKLFQFDELSEQAKETAIENVRQSYYEYNNFAEWAIDDCGLLEPPHKEMVELFGADYEFPLLENTREKFYFSTDRDWYIDISNAMEVTDTDMFLTWLGIDLEKFEDADGWNILDYKIGKDTIEFETNDWSIEFTQEQNDMLYNAVEKFESHCDDILRRLETDIDYRFTDEAIVEDILANEMEFTEDGEKF